MIKRDVLAEQINKIIKIFLIIFAIGSPFSISLAQIGLVPAIIFWLFKIIFVKQRDFYSTFLDIAILIYLLGTVLSSVFCPYPTRILKSVNEAWHILLLYVMVDVADEKLIKRMINLLFLFTLLTAIYGVWQYFSGWDLVRNKALKPNAPGAQFFDITGGYGLHLTYGGYVMMITLLGISLFLNHYQDNKKMFWYYLLGTGIIGFTVYGSYARSAWAGFIGGLLFLGFLKNKKYVIVILLALFIFGVLLYFFVPTFQYKAKTFTKLPESRRWQIWSVSLKMIKDYPVFGVGHGNFKKHYEDYRDEVNWREPTGHPHNDFLSIYLTTGLIGFIGYMLLWFLIFKKSLQEIKLSNNDKKRKNIIIALISGVLAFLVAGLSQNYFTDSENSMLLWLFISILVCLYYQNKKKISVSDRIKMVFHK